MTTLTQAEEYLAAATTVGIRNLPKQAWRLVYAAGRYARRRYIALGIPVSDIPAEVVSTFAVHYPQTIPQSAALRAQLFAQRPDPIAEGFADALLR
jgi:hypothetical protein